VPFFCTIMQTGKQKLRTGYALLWLTGILLWLGWPTDGFTPLLWVAWIPLLLACEILPRGYGFFFNLWAALLIWNTGTTWWIWNSTGAGAAGAIMANSLLMCFPVMLYRFFKRKLPVHLALLGFAACWLSFEYLHHNWQLSWPWLTLGNAPAALPGWIQWYSYTGTLGGTAWILAVNILLFVAINAQLQKKPKMVLKPALAGLLLWLLPIALSTLMLKAKNKQQPPAQYNVVVVQPNVEAYTEKFNTDPLILARSLITLSENTIDSNTRLVVWPETALPTQAWEHELDQNPVFQEVFQFVNRHPQMLLVTGMDGYKLWGQQNPGGFSIRQMKNGEYYEAFNTALARQAGNPPQLYYKSKLVPGVETLPTWLNFMGSLFDDFGGIAGSLGRSKEPVVFSAAGNPFKPAPIICYESIYGDYVQEYVNKGANILTIITNDGWWGNTAGHKQHMLYARLRAIETGKWVARSANTGISCFIDPTGKVYQPTPWNKQAALKMNIPALNEAQPSHVLRFVLNWLPLLMASVLILLALIPQLWKKM